MEAKQHPYEQRKIHLDQVWTPKGRNQLMEIQGLSWDFSNKQELHEHFKEEALILVTQKVNEVFLFSKQHLKFQINIYQQQEEHKSMGNTSPKRELQGNNTEKPM